MKSSDFWLGDEESLLSHFETEKKLHLTPNADLQGMSIRAMTEGVDSEDEFGEFGYMTSRHGNLAVVNISGSLTDRDRPYNRYLGMVSYNEIRSAVIASVENSEVEGIVLNMDTPGGKASGVSELSDFLSEVDEKVKPIYTYTGTAMASGGYWLGSVGRELYAAKLATVGSIGVVTVHASYEKMYKDNGIEVTVLRAGEFKALGSPYEKLNDKAKGQIESQMNAIYDVFLETISDNRGTSVQALKETAAEGRVFVGADSLAVGLVDHISSFDAAMADISEKVRSSSNRSLSHPHETTVGNIDMSGKKKVLTAAGVAAIESGVPEAEVYDTPEMVTLVEDLEEGAPDSDADASATEGDADGAADTSSDDGSDAEDGDGEGEPNADANAGGNVALDGLLSKVTNLTIESAELKAKLSAAEIECSEAKAHEASLVKIAVQSIQKMQVSLGATPSKLDDASPAAVLEQYNRTYSQFNQKFKVGSAAQVPEGEDFRDNKTGEERVNSTVDSAVTRLTTRKVS